MKQTFKKSAARAGQGSANELIKAVIAERPDLKNETFVVPGRGKCSVTVMTEKEVFKALTDNSDEFLIQEYQFLDHVKKQNPSLPIPAITTIGEQSAFFGMTRVKGASLDVETLNSLPHDKQMQLADQIAMLNVTLSKALNDRDRQRLKLNGMGVDWRMTPDKIRKSLESPQAREMLGKNLAFCETLVRSFADRYKESEAEKRVLVLHSDMHADNLFYDPESGQLSLIDIGVGRPMQAEIAFSPFKHTYPSAFVDRMLDTFSAKSGIKITAPDIDREICLYNILQLRYAVERGDQKDINFITKNIENYKNAYGADMAVKPDKMPDRKRRASFR